MEKLQTLYTLNQLYKEQIEHPKEEAKQGIKSFLGVLRREGRSVSFLTLSPRKGVLVASAAVGNNGAEQETTPQLYSLLDNKLEYYVLVSILPKTLEHKFNIRGKLL
ncbi:hypothetical protein TorRG33x02_299430 [Trema orientale]|uniref:Uncharacterized protein n=1 Tax=Trema orientale TaxID=63057 RepID=A0A2P5C2Y5_TREOI|nr:hypothetical protein TorRG33x02_299430 [Trema orientale]